MPNWCYNYAEFSHEDKAQMDKLRDAIDKKEVLKTLVPLPVDLEENDGWYNWCVSNWGTKWDLCDIDILKDDGQTIGIQFSTAWSPPTRAYETLNEMGFSIDAYYSEMGMGFCGHYTDGVDDYYEFEEYTSDWLENNIPSDIIDACGLYSYFEEEEEA